MRGKVLILLKADGTALVKPPDVGEDDRVRGTWKQEKPGLVLHADGTAAAWPQTENQNRVLRGAWSLKEGKITAKLKRGSDTQTGTLLLAVDGTELILKKVIDPDGETKEQNVRFRRQKQVHIGQFPPPPAWAAFFWHSTCF